MIVGKILEYFNPHNNVDDEDEFPAPDIQVPPEGLRRSTSSVRVEVPLGRLGPRVDEGRGTDEEEGGLEVEAEDAREQSWTSTGTTLVGRGHSMIANGTRNRRYITVGNEK